VISVAFKTLLTTRLLIYKDSEQHRPEDNIGFRPRCLHTFFSEVVPMDMSNFGLSSKQT